MDSNYLIAPAKYNITDEITKFDSDKIALIWKDNHNERTWTYHELLVNARKFANVLTKQGIQKGDHVIVMTPRLLETYAIYMGLWMVGAVIIPASELLKAHDLAYRIDHAGVKGIITYKGMTEEFEKIEHTPSVKTRILIEEEKVGWLDYSSSCLLPQMISPLSKRPVTMPAYSLSQAVRLEIQKASSMFTGGAMPIFELPLITG
ncbi:acetate-CoA ligase [Listeria fleischmannii subsp. fleischmannii LU2006-1]|nr:acetate-CoA ligase [Listeria fleischmannii subsp. fleischmannii LU2006-1]